MTGQRLPDGFEPTTEWYEKLGFTEMPKGGYGKDSQGVWCVVTPNGRYGSLANYDVLENPDGTITVSPSILVSGIDPKTYTPEERARMVELVGEERTASCERGIPGWHGYLKLGVWSEC